MSNGQQRTGLLPPERENFEKWAPTRGLSLAVNRRTGVYVYADSARAWEAWQAALAQSAQAPDGIRVQDATVYVLNSRDNNRWWATVQPGQDDEGKRISDEECQQAAQRLAQSAQAPAPEPAAWMDPNTSDVIHALRKHGWLTNFGLGGTIKASTYTVLLNAQAAPAQPAPPLDQIERARRNIAEWPQWMREAAVEASAHLPSAAPAQPAQSVEAVMELADEYAAEAATKMSGMGGKPDQARVALRSAIEALARGAR